MTKLAVKRMSSDCSPKTTRRALLQAAAAVLGLRLPATFV
jgi:hypothetical protein